MGMSPFIARNLIANLLYGAGVAAIGVLAFTAGSNALARSRHRERQKQRLRRRLYRRFGWRPADAAEVEYELWDTQCRDDPARRAQ
jgi:hypothetical protein